MPLVLLLGFTGNLAVTAIGDEEAEAQVKVDHGMTRAMAKKQARALPRALAM